MDLIRFVVGHQAIFAHHGGTAWRSIAETLRPTRWSNLNWLLMIHPRHDGAYIWYNINIILNIVDSRDMLGQTGPGFCATVAVGFCLGITKESMSRAQPDSTSHKDLVALARDSKAAFV